MSRGVCNKVAFNIIDIPKTFWHDCSTTTLDTFAWHCLVVADLRMYFIYAWGKLLTLWCGFEETFEFDVCQILWFSCVLATWVWLVTVTEMVIGNFNFERCEKLSFSFRIFQSLEVFPPVAKLANFIYFNFLSRIKFKNTTIQIIVIIPHLKQMYSNVKIWCFMWWYNTLWASARQRFPSLSVQRERRKKASAQNSSIVSSAAIPNQEWLNYK